MSNDSWNDGPTSGPNPQYGGGQQPGGYGASGGHGQQSLGQDYSNNQESGPQTGPNQGSAPGQGSYGNQGYPQQGYQQGPPQGPQGPQSGGRPPQSSGSGEPGPADLFTDIGFTKSLTSRIASLTFLVVVIWAVLRFVRVLAEAWGSAGTTYNGVSVRRHGGFEAFMMSLEAIGFLVLTVALARLLLELCVNVARLANKRS